MDAAANLIEKAIVANPTYAEAYNNLGQSVCLTEYLISEVLPSLIGQCA